MSFWQYIKNCWHKMTRQPTGLEAAASELPIRNGQSTSQHHADSETPYIAPSVDVEASPTTPPAQPIEHAAAGRPSRSTRIRNNFNRCMGASTPVLDALAKIGNLAALFEVVPAEAIEIFNITESRNCSGPVDPDHIPLWTIPTITWVGAGVGMALAGAQIYLVCVSRAHWNLVIDAAFKLVINPALLWPKANTLGQYLYEARTAQLISKDTLQTLGVASLSMMAISFAGLGALFRGNPSWRGQPLPHQPWLYRIVNSFYTAITGVVSALVVPRLLNLLLQSINGYEEYGQPTALVTAATAFVLFAGSIVALTVTGISEQRRKQLLQMISPNELMKDLGYYQLITLICSWIICSQPEQSGFLPAYGSALAVGLALVVAASRGVNVAYAWTQDWGAVEKVEAAHVEKLESGNSCWCRMFDKDRGSKAVTAAGGAIAQPEAAKALLAQEAKTDDNNANMSYRTQGP